MPRLIINADDLGLTSGVNRAIEEAGRVGAITSATLMASSPQFEEAVAIAHTVPELKIGCHIVLIDGEPLSSHVPSLTNGAARFRSSLKDFALAATRKRIMQDEIQREAETQIRKIQSAGLVVTHVDTHKHTHMFPHVLRPVLKAAQACGVSAIRNPFERFRAWPGAAVISTPALWIRALEVALLLKYASDFSRIVREEGLSTTEGAVGVIATGKLDQPLLLRTIQALPEGTWELVCHPGYVDAALAASGTRLRASRQIELQALTSEETRNALTKRGVELISYEDLALGS
ncbi:MAG TPA: ChbG/HpnK family deacetylase [Candidatus Angelobacter sp.]